MRGRGQGREGFLRGRMPGLKASGERGQVRREKNAILDKRMSRQKPRGVRAQEFRSILLGEWKGVIEMETKPCKGIEIVH